MSKRYNVIEVLEMWDEIPDDDQDTDESSSDDDVVDNDYIQPGDADVDDDYIQPGDEVIDTSETQEIPDMTATTATPKPHRKVAGKGVSSSAQKKEKTLEQLELVEHFLFKNDHPYPLSATQIKCLQKHIHSKSKEKLSVAQVKRLVEIARRQWKKIDKPSEDHSSNFHEGPNMEYFSDCHTPADIFFQFLDTDIVDNIVFQTNLYSTSTKRTDVFCL